MMLCALNEENFFKTNLNVNLIIITHTNICWSIIKTKRIINKTDTFSREFIINRSINLIKTNI